MNPNDFVYIQTYRGCLRDGVPDGIAANFAQLAQERFKQGRHPAGKVSKLIGEMIGEAKRAAKR